MEKITLEKTHTLLEKLTEYVMAELPALKRDVAGLKVELTKKADKEDVMHIYLELSRALEEKADKKDVERLGSQFHLLLEGMDSVSKELDINRTERAAVSKTLDVYNDRIGALEEHIFGTRVRDVDASGGKDNREE